MSKTTNHLVNETSPYLLQHAHNPVDWHAWNNETLSKAKAEGKMMLVSIGYSACHWCHVMERESFENEEIARVMNENFVCIKVDREERPDVDAVYMNAVQLIHGHGGWPLNCFTLPDGKPFYGGTYFQPEQWLSLLENITNLYAFRREDIESQARQITDGINEVLVLKPSVEIEEFDSGIIDRAYQMFEKNLDPINGGLKGAPKFPLPTSLVFLLRYYHRSKNPDLKTHLKLSLDKMAYGGIYDQVGGGFSRYSVDEKWHIPHFEKMLYDNAQLISLYTEAFLAFKDYEYLRIAEETAMFLLDDLYSPEGLFYSALDADSDGGEGNYYVWTKLEFDEVLGDDARMMGHFFGIDKEAWWEGEKNVLVQTDAAETFAKQQQISVRDFKMMVQKTRAKLTIRRGMRTRPGLDDKALTSWNALGIKAFVDLYNATGNRRYLEVATNAAEFILSGLFDENGGLFHSFKKDIAHISGFLEDYAFLMEALIELYQATFIEKWLTKAVGLLEYVFDNFYDDSDGFFWFTNNQTHELVARKKETLDSVMPSSNATMAMCLFKLGHMLDKQNHVAAAKRMLLAVSDKIQNYPSSYSNWLNLSMLLAGPFLELVYTGPNAEMRWQEMAQFYFPSKVVLGSATDSELPLLKGRFTPGKDLIYICTNKECKRPIEDVNTALLMLEEITT